MKEKLVQGYVDGTFRPDARITRSEMLTMIHNAMISSGLYSQTIKPVEIDRILNQYEDGRQISQWARAATAASVKSGITTGVDKAHLAPDADADRAQAAVFLYRMLEQLGLIN